MTGPEPPLVFWFLDAFALSRAVPAEVKRVVEEIARKRRVILVGRRGEHVNDVASAEHWFYADRKAFWVLSGRLKQAGVRRVVIQSMLTVDSLLASICCALRGLRLVYQPFSQFTTYGFSRQLFPADPNVRQLEATARSVARTGDRRSRWQKRAAALAYRGLNRWFTDGFLVFSSFEKRELAKLLGVKPEKCHIAWWAKDAAEPNVKHADFFGQFSQGQGKLRFVVWSRLDYAMKGIDRLLKGVAHARKTEAQALPFHLFLIGPDYVGGAAQVARDLETLGLADGVTVLGAGQYPPGDLAPLAQADASILLSRWDGFPRALRESVTLDTPVLVSEETHFGDFVDEFKVGLTVRNADDPREVATALMELAKILAGPGYDAAHFEAARRALDTHSVAAQMQQALARCGV